MKTYIKFLLSTFLLSLIKVSLILTTLILIINIFEEIEFLKKTNSHFLLPFFLSLLNTPSIIYDIFPFIFLISTQFFFIKLIENNQLQIFKYSGLTNIKILSIIGSFVFILGIFIVVFFYNISSQFKNYYLELKNNFSEDDKYLAVITENGLWIKDEIDEKINIINATEIDEQYLNNVIITQYDKNYKYIRTIQGERIDISQNKWKILNSTIFKDNISLDFDQIYFNSNFNLKKINSLFSNLSSLSILELYSLKKNYLSLNYSITEVDSHINKIFSYPFYLSIMTMIASVIMFNIKYQKNSLFKIILGISISVIIYYITYFFNVMGVNEKIPLILSIWLPLFILSLIILISIIRLNEK